MWGEGGYLYWGGNEGRAFCIGQEMMKEVLSVNRAGRKVGHSAMKQE